MDAGPAEAGEEGAGVVAESGDERGDGERHGLRLPDPFAEAHIDENQRELDAGQEVVDGLENRVIQAQPVADDEVEGGRQTEEREEGAGGADGEREGEFVGSGALGELGAQGSEEAALPKGRARSVGGGCGHGRVTCRLGRRIRGGEVSA